MSPLTLAPQTQVQRPISLPEYYHAACGASKYTLENPRICTMVIKGSGNLSPQRLEQAVYEAAQANPGARMRLDGKRHRARWTTDNAAHPHFRVVERCEWDGLSNAGMEFAEETALPLETGPIAEVIFARGKNSFIIFRVRHAVMDGMGMLHFLSEIFRALRNEPLVGSNAAFSDVELMRSITSTPWQNSKQSSTLSLAGKAQGDEIGDAWRCVRLPLSKQKNLSAFIAEFSARYARSFGEGGVRIAVPMDLRRHLRGLVSTMNFTGILHIDLDAQEGADQFFKKLKKAVKEKRDAAFPNGIDWVRYLPLSWIDFVAGRRRANYLRRNEVETVMITNFGTLDMADYSCEDFAAENFFSLPIPGNSFIALYTSGSYTNIVVGMPKIYASNGRMDDFCKKLTESLATQSSISE